MRKFFFTSDPGLGFSQGQDVQNDPRVGGTYRVVMPHAWLQAQMGKTDPLTQQEIEEGLASMANETAQGWGYMLDGLAIALA